MGTYVTDSELIGFAAKAGSRRLAAFAPVYAAMPWTQAAILICFKQTFRSHQLLQQTSGPSGFGMHQNPWQESRDQG
jgi:hypothetical protein